MTGDERLLDIFFEIQRGLPRQGPGSDESTLKALSLCAGLPARPAILDVGCGPGMQTLALARATRGAITAVDTAAEYLGELRSRAGAAGLGSRIEILNRDMNDLGFAPASFDLVWSEGAAYIMGFADALKAWRPLLRPGGWLAVSELVWLEANPPAEAAAFFADGYPAMTNVETVLAALGANGYEAVSHFTLPDRDWWQHYYAPLEAKLPALREKYRSDEAALEILASTEREIEIRRSFPDCYGYAFFIGRRAT